MPPTDAFGSAEQPPDLTLVETSYDWTCRDTWPASDRFVSMVLDRGVLDMDDGRTVHRLTERGDVGLVVPDRDVLVTGTGLHLWMVDLALEDVRRAAAGLTDRPVPPLRFHGPAPVDRERARFWFHTVQYAAALADQPDSPLRQPLIRHEVVQTLALAGLRVFVDPAVLAPGDEVPAPVEPPAMRRALDFIRTHAAEPIGLSDIAAAAGAGPRALQYAFRRHRSTTPLLYLRQVRLEAAHHELVAADPGGEVRVAEVARRWGWVSPGAFSTAYREQFGRPPVRTLRS